VGAESPAQVDEEKLVDAFRALKKASLAA